MVQIIIFVVGHSAYLSNRNTISREHIFIGFNKFPSLMCWFLPNLWGNFYVQGRFSTPSVYNLWSRSPCIPLQPQNAFLREHIFIGFNKFPSLVCWCIVIHYHQLQWPTLFRRMRWDSTCVPCDVCTDTGPPVLSPTQKD